MKNKTNKHSHCRMVFNNVLRNKGLEIVAIPKQIQKSLSTVDDQDIRKKNRTRISQERDYTTGVPLCPYS